MQYKDFKKWANKEMKTKRVFEIYRFLNISSTSFYYYMKQADQNPDKFVPGKIANKIRPMKL